MKNSELFDRLVQLNPGLMVKTLSEHEFLIGKTWYTFKDGKLTSGESCVDCGSEQIAEVRPKKSK